MTSGVHQGSVLGPILFLVSINDLSDELSSQVRLFADDTSGERITSTVLYEETRSGENLVQLSVNYEGGLKRTDVLHLEPPEVQGSRFNRRSGGWQGTTNRFGQTLCVGGQMERITDNSHQRQLAPRQLAPKKTRPKTTHPTFRRQLAPFRRQIAPHSEDNSPHHTHRATGPYH